GRRTEDGGRTASRDEGRKTKVGTVPSVKEATTFVLEIGTEELPPADLDSALAQVKELAPKLLADARLTHGAIRVFGTPRRIALLVEALNPLQADSESVVKGPPASRAFDSL